MKDLKFHFPIIIIDEDFRSENASGLGIRALAKALGDEGVEVLGVTSYGDLTSFVQQQSRAGGFILSIDDEELAATRKRGASGRFETARGLRRRDPVPELGHSAVPLRRDPNQPAHPNSILKELHGFIHMFEDTPEFVARYIIRESKAYLDSLPPRSSGR